MKALTDFVLLRPLVTRSALLAIWYLYLAATVLQLGQYGVLLFVTGQVYSAGLNPHYYVSLLPPILFALLHLALVRIFLEMALRFIETRLASS